MTVYVSKKNEVEILYKFIEPLLIINDEFGFTIIDNEEKEFAFHRENFSVIILEI